jgi:hypothetical protein
MRWKPWAVASLTARVLGVPASAHAAITGRWVGSSGSAGVSFDVEPAPHGKVVTDLVM